MSATASEIQQKWEGENVSLTNAARSEPIKHRNSQAIVVSYDLLTTNCSIVTKCHRRAAIVISLKRHWSE